MTGQATNIGEFQYRVSIRPTAAVHRLRGNALYDFVVEPSAMPERTSWAMMIPGVGAVSDALRRHCSARGSYAA